MQKKYHGTLAVILGTIFTVLISACGGGGSKNDPGATNTPPRSVEYTLSGIVTNSPVEGATVTIRNMSGALLALVTTRNDGTFTVDAGAPPPYHLHAAGGFTQLGQYMGELEAHCENLFNLCQITPYSTALVRLSEDYGFNVRDSLALAATAFGFSFDPFGYDEEGNVVSSELFDLSAARAAIDNGHGLGIWVSDTVDWLRNPTSTPPAGLPNSHATDLTPVSSFAFPATDLAVAFFYGTPLPVYYDRANFNINTCTPRPRSMSTFDCSQELPVPTFFLPQSGTFITDASEISFTAFSPNKQIIFSPYLEDQEHTDIGLSIVYNEAIGTDYEDSLSQRRRTYFNYNGMLVVQIPLKYTFVTRFTNYYLSFIIGTTQQIESYLASPIATDPGFPPIP